jgi:hypothetical protein
MEFEKRRLEYVESHPPDPAAILGAAMSLYKACRAQALLERVNLSEVYSGGDQFMREVMRIAGVFEGWATKHVNFGELDEVWPYFLQDRFGLACLSDISASDLAGFGERGCVRVAQRLGLPLLRHAELPMPVCMESPHPNASSEFLRFRLQMVRDSVDGESAAPFTAADDPFDPNYGPVYFSIYGVRANGLLEHIASRRTVYEALELASALIPGIRFSADARVQHRA